MLAVDIPSGVDGLTGEAADGAVDADVTVTFAALKPGHVLLPGRSRCGVVAVADIGLDVSAARAHLVQAGDAGAWLPERPVAAHKWMSAVWLIAGSPGMTGAAVLAARGAQRAGAGYVRLSVPGAGTEFGAPVEVVTNRPAGDGLERRGARRRRSLQGARRRTGSWRSTGGRHTGARARPRPGPSSSTATGSTPLAATRGRPGRARSSHPTTGSTSGSSARLPGPIGWRPPATWPRSPVALSSSRGRRRSWPAATVRSWSPPRAVRPWPPPARATCWPASSARSVPRASTRARAAAVGAFVHGRCGLGFARGLVAGDLPDRLPAVLDDLTNEREIHSWRGTRRWPTS